MAQIKPERNLCIPDPVIVEACQGVTTISKHHDPSTQRMLTTIQLSRIGRSQSMPCLPLPVAYERSWQDRNLDTLLCNLCLTFSALLPRPWPVHVHRCSAHLSFPLARSTHTLYHRISLLGHTWSSPHFSGNLVDRLRRKLSVYLLASWTRLACRARLTLSQQD